MLEVAATKDVMSIAEVAATTEEAVADAIAVDLAADTEAAIVAAMESAIAALVVTMVGMAAAAEIITFLQRHRPMSASLRANGPMDCLVKSCVHARVRLDPFRR